MTCKTKMSVTWLDLLVGFQYWKNCVPHTAANLRRVHRAFICFMHSLTAPMKSFYPNFEYLLTSENKRFFRHLFLLLEP